MGKKLTLQEVKNIIADKMNNQCEVLSTNYVNNSTPLIIRCKCGKTFERPYYKMREKNRTAFCKECLNKMRSQKYREKIENVISYINSTGCEYIEGCYVNYNSILTIRCRCGNVFKKTYAKFKGGQDRCPECGKKSSRDSKIKYTLDDVKKEISKSGYVILDDSLYETCTSRVPCMCSRGHKFTLVFNQYLIGCSGCSKCAYINLRGEKCSNYKGGKSKVLDCLRDTCDTWKKECKKKYDYRCAVTNEKPQRLFVHHLESFDKILEKAKEETGIPVLKIVSDYSDPQDFYTLKDKVYELNQNCVGVPLKKGIHLDFHKKYGNGNNTAEQFDEYLRRYHNKTLNEILK